MFIKSYESFLKENYKGEHLAPNKKDDSPIYDVTLKGSYPEDFYSSNGLRYYGYQQTPHERESYSKVTSLRDKPNGKVYIYRAVPKIINDYSEYKNIVSDMKVLSKIMKVEVAGTLIYRLNDYKDDMSIDLYDKINSAEPGKDTQLIYDTYDDFETRKKQIEKSQPKIKINAGDWVSLTKEYAKEHGKNSLNNNYKILSKKVSAKDVYTDGNDLNEFGYDPS